MQRQAGKAAPSDALGGAILTKDGNGNFEIFPTGWIDGTNKVAKVARKLAAGTVLSADGNTLTGVGLLARLVVSNAHATNATTVAVYDNTSATGTKLCADLVVAAKLDVGGGRGGALRFGGLFGLHGGHTFGHRL